MKKEYTAPDLYFESFELSESIAAGCDSTGKAIVSSLLDMDSTLFADNSSCTNEYSLQGLGEDYCYWSGTYTLLLS